MVPGSAAPSPTGPFGDYYVWSDTDAPYSDARIIFIDTEVSNWTFDPIRRQFFWHRFFSHQPDLNFENPRVRAAMFDVVRFWMDLGIDGFRLDAVPYLFEEEGTNCENLPQDARVPRRAARDGRRRVPRPGPARRGQPAAGRGRRLLRHEEAPECQMCFHFPVMPRLYYSLREERAAPIVDVFADTPAIPRGAQWGTFLRNHDELTLEMVTPEERSAMYGWYAPDPRMRANVGIRRRLAPLLDNSRPEIELIHALLLSLPGSPCLYYGDEIGMGDNIWLNDRDAVRTPMQWTPDRNSGFSAVDPGKLYLPVDLQPRLPLQHRQRRGADGDVGSSLLHWLRGMLQVRSRHPVFGLGDFQVCPTENEAILSFVRHHEGDRPSRHRRAGQRDGAVRQQPLLRPQATTVRAARRSMPGRPARRPVRRPGLPQDRRRRKGVGDPGFPGLLLVPGPRRRGLPAGWVSGVAEIHRRHPRAHQARAR